MLRSREAKPWLSALYCVFHPGVFLLNCRCVWEHRHAEKWSHYQSISHFPDGIALRSRIWRYFSVFGASSVLTRSPTPPLERSPTPCFTDGCWTVFLTFSVQFQIWIYLSIRHVASDFRVQLWLYLAYFILFSPFPFLATNPSFATFSNKVLVKKSVLNKIGWVFGMDWK